jgi:hypothetical protein
MFDSPTVPAPGVNITEHAPTPADTLERVQGDVTNVPEYELVQLTVPVGTVGGAPFETSATSAVHVVGVPTSSMEGKQVTVVAVESTTVTSKTLEVGLE